MANLNVEFNFSGFKELEKLMQKSAKVEQEVRQAVESNGKELKSRMGKFAYFEKGYQSGDTKRSMQAHMSTDGLSVTVGPTTEYAPYLEYGTRYMEAQPFVRPAFEVQVYKLVRELNNIIKENT